MAIKAIAMDIDGTLTNDQTVISPRTREKLLAAQESGIKLILASGRPAWGLHALAQELDLQNHDGLLVAFNGAHVVDAQTDEVLFDQAMPADELHRLIDHLRNFDVIPMISLGRDLHVVDSYHCMITLPDGSQKNIVKYERDACDLKSREVESLHEVADAYPVDKLLTGAVSMDIYEVKAACEALGGVAVPAHVEKDSYALLSVLGFLPEDLPFAAVELHDASRLGGLVEKGLLPAGLEVLSSSDAHRMEDVACSLHALAADSVLRRLL